ncbi:MAG: hypothetical protein ABI317_05140, partial [Gaiellales bacterium]
MSPRLARAAAAALALAAALSLSSGGAQGATTDPNAYGNGVATSATHVVSVEDPSEATTCPLVSGDGAVEQVSDDRGQTWAAGPCVPARASPVEFDPTADLLVYSSAASVLWLAPSGAVATMVAVPANSRVVAADDGFAYLMGPSGATRMARDGSVAPCAALVSSDGVSDPKLIALAGGVLIGASDGPYAGKLSRDDCSTFTPDPNLASCSPGISRAIGPNAITCDGLTPSAYYDDRYSHLLQLPTLDERALWTWDGHTLETMDTLATEAAPTTWPMATPYEPRQVTGDPVPSGPIASALALLNRTWRTPLGLPPLAWSALAAQVAFDHVREWDLSGVLPDPGAGSETAGAAGFTGVDAATRCTQVDLMFCAESDAPGTANIAVAVSRMLADPSFATSLIVYPRIGLAATASGSVAVLAPEIAGETSIETAPPGSTFDFSLPANGPSSAIRVWPPDGATGVPASWSSPGGLRYDPLEAFGDPPAIGYPIDVVTQGSGSWQLLDAHGTPVPLDEPGQQAPLTTATFASWIAFPVTPLTPGARYSIALDPDFGSPQTLRFTVAGGTPVAAAKRCVVSVRQARAGGMSRVTINHARTSCTGVHLQWRRRAPQHWRAVAKRGIVAPAKRVVYWRAIA